VEGDELSSEPLERQDGKEDHLAETDVLAVTLAILRNLRRMSQRDLAEAAGVTNSAVSDYERGKVDPQSSTLRKLFRGLDLPLSVLEETHVFILRIRSQVGAQGSPHNSRLATQETIDLAAVHAEEKEIWAEVAILAAEGGRFLARFIRVLFLTLFWMARASRRHLPRERKAPRS
jgi:transcriptional regulator with XRE-family HTH domain